MEKRFKIINRTVSIILGFIILYSINTVSISEIRKKQEKIEVVFVKPKTEEIQKEKKKIIKKNVMQLDKTKNPQIKKRRIKAEKTKKIDIQLPQKAEIDIELPTSKYSSKKRDIDKNIFSRNSNVNMVTIEKDKTDSKKSFTEKRIDIDEYRSNTKRFSRGTTDIPDTAEYGLLPEIEKESTGSIRKKSISEEVPNILVKTKRESRQISDGIINEPDNYAVSEFSSDKGDLFSAGNLPEFLTWMRQNKSTSVPNAIKHYLEIESDDYISKVYYNGWNIYMHYSKDYNQLKILLIGNDYSILLADSDFQMKSQLFQSGQVIRENNIIKSIIASQKSLDSDDVNLFYSVFINWSNFQGLKIK